MESTTTEPIVESTTAPIVEATPETTKAPEQTVDVTKVQKEAYRHAMEQIDTALLELGFEKPSGAKTSEYLKEILKEKGTKEPASKVIQTDDKDAIITQLKASLKENEGKIADLTNSTSRAKTDMYVDSLLNQANLNIPANLSEQETARMKGVLRNALKSELEREIEFREVDGKFRAYHKDGNPILDDQANYLDPSKILEKDFSAFLAKAESTPKPIGTGGTKPTEPTNKVIPSSVKTKYDYYDYLNGKDMVTGSKLFNENLAKAKEENPIMFK